MSTIRAAFLQSLVTRLEGENTVGVSMAGSHACAAGGTYSDVDIQHYVRQMPADPAGSYYLRFMDGYLVSISVSTVESESANLRSPQKAIWAVPGLRQARILLDKGGLLAALKAAAEIFSWEPLQAAANAFASWNLSGCAEEVHKILDGLVKRDESKTLYAVWGLTRALALTLLVQGGVLIETENAFVELAQATAGHSSAWTEHFRQAIGLDQQQTKEPAFIGYGMAGLRLYCETAWQMQAILLPEHAAVINRTLEIITEAGF
jgi:hypothetical protein